MHSADLKTQMSFQEFANLDESIEEIINDLKKKFPKGPYFVKRGFQTIAEGFTVPFDEWASYLVKAPPPAPYIPYRSPRPKHQQPIPPPAPVPTPAPVSSTSQNNPNNLPPNFRSTGNRTVDDYLVFLERFCFFDLKYF